MNGRSVGTRGREESQISRPAIRNDWIYNTDRRGKGGSRDEKQSCVNAVHGPFQFRASPAQPKASHRRHNKARQAVPDAPSVANGGMRAETLSWLKNGLLADGTVFHVPVPPGGMYLISRPANMAKILISLRNPFLQQVLDGIAILL